jgi:hypothetical protein
MQLVLSCHLAGDIVKQLPQEAKRFQNIDKNYMKIVTSALETQNVVATCFGNELMKSMLPHLLEQLELCQARARHLLLVENGRLACTPGVPANTLVGMSVRCM